MEEFVTLRSDDDTPKGDVHFMLPGSAVLDRADWLVWMITAFLDAPMREAEQAAGGRA